MDFLHDRIFSNAIVIYNVHSNLNIMVLVIQKMFYLEKKRKKAKNNDFKSSFLFIILAGNLNVCSCSYV